MSRVYGILSDREILEQHQFLEVAQLSKMSVEEYEIHKLMKEIKYTYKDRSGYEDECYKFEEMWREEVTPELFEGMTDEEVYAYYVEKLNKFAKQSKCEKLGSLILMLGTFTLEFFVDIIPLLSVAYIIPVAIIEYWAISEEHTRNLNENKDVGWY